MYKKLLFPILYIAIPGTLIILICSYFNIFSDNPEILILILIMIYILAILVGLLNYYYSKIEKLIKP